MIDLKVWKAFWQFYVKFSQLGISQRNWEGGLCLSVNISPQSPV